jgi:hypothetical protein
MFVFQLFRSYETGSSKRLEGEYQKIAADVAGKWRGMWELNPRGLSTTDLAGLPHTRLGESRTPLFQPIHYTVFQLNLSGN